MKIVPKPDPLPSKDDYLEFKTEEAKRDQNNFSIWFPKIKDKLPDGLKVPKTRIIRLTDKWFDWLFTDDYKPEKIEEFSQFLNDKLVGFKPYDQHKKLFVKTGTFSDKFDFSRPMVNPGEYDQLGEKVLNIFYQSMLVGAGTSLDVIVREYVESKDNYYIYYGMPLRQEIRFFIDFDHNKLLGWANYWNDQYMKKLCDDFSPEMVLKCNDETIEQLPESNRQRFKDFQTWHKWDQTVNLDQVMKETHMLNMIDKVIQANNNAPVSLRMSGKWSFDVMVTRDRLNYPACYFIDMAKMGQSALTDVMIQHGDD